jgi:hypothetical protein
LYVYFSIEKWEKRDTAIALGGRSIYRCLFATKYMFDRAREIAELYLDSEEHLREWREKRRQGRVKVELDDEYVDRAKQVTRMDVGE